jgi:MYXO-CTERM domain-containing protein
MALCAAALLPALTACSASGSGFESAPEITRRTSAALSTGLVISQVYGGGGNGSATYANDFVEIFNLGATAVPLAGLSLQYASSTGDFSAANLITLPADTVQPGQYYLVGLGSGGAVGATLPAPDFSDTSVNLAATAGKVALVDGTTVLPCDAGACTLTGVVDLVGYGAATTLYEGSGPAKAPTGSGAAANGPSVQRRLAGCAETDDNAADFENPVLTANPRNTASPVNTCAAGDAGAGEAGDASAGDAEAGPPDAQGGDDGPADGAGDDGSGEAGDGGPDAATGDGATDAAGDDGSSDGGTGGTQGLVVSQVYGGGGNVGATYTNDFVELFNRGSSPVSLDGLSIQYASATSAFQAANVAVLPSATIDPGHYYLVSLGSGGANGAALPAADFTDVDVNASASSGKIALAIGTAALGCGSDAGLCSAAQLVDLVGYGAGASDFEGTGPATAASGNTTAVLRRGGGCVDTDDNAADFENPALAVDPRSSATPFHDCTLVVLDAGGTDAGGVDAGGEAGGTDAGGGKDAGGGADSGAGHDGGFTGPDATAPADASTGSDAAPADSGISTLSPGSSGCSCRTAGEGEPGAPAQAGLLGALALALAALRRRGRQAHCAKSQS